MFGLMAKTPAVATMTPSDVEAALARKDIHLVDVREHNEWSAQRIPGAKHAPLSELPRLARGLPTDKPVVFHCLSGGRSARAVALCRELGLPHDTHMAGGITAWQAHGLPVIR